MDLFSGIGNYFQNIADKSLDFEQEWGKYLFPVDPSAEGVAGYPSNVRHSAASSALSNIIKNKMHNMFATPGYEDQKPSGLFDLIGKVGSLAAMTGHEIPQNNTWQLEYDVDPWNQVSPAHPSERYDPDLNPLPPEKNWLKNQYTEDMLANLFGIIHGGESEDPDVEAQTLKSELAYNKGIINNALLNIAKDRNYLTRYDLQSYLEQPVRTHHEDGGRGWKPDWGHRLRNRGEKQIYSRTNERTVPIRGNNFAAGQAPQPTSRPRRGRERFSTGGLAHLRAPMRWQNKCRTQDRHG